MLTRPALLTLCLGLVWTSSALAQSTVVELNDAGWKFVEQRDGARAAKMFAEALSLEPNNPVLLFGAGSAAYVDRRMKDAAAHLRRALDFNPKFTPASLLLGEIAYAEGDVTTAIGIYEKALKYAPGEQRLAERLATWRADSEVHSNFHERRLNRFRVMFQGHPDAPLAIQATEILNAAFWDIGAKLGAYPADDVLVVLYTEQQFRDITQAPEWANGIYDGRIKIPAAGATQSPQSFERVLTHELVHAMIATTAPRGVPAWLHEGLAQYFEGDDPQAARRRLRTAGRDRIMPLGSLTGSFSRFGAAQAQVAYDEALVAVDYIMQRPGLNWPTVFRALGETDQVERTFASFGFPYSDLEAQFSRQPRRRPGKPTLAPARRSHTPHARRSAASLAGRFSRHSLHDRASADACRV